MEMPLCLLPGLPLVRTSFSLFLTPWVGLHPEALPSLLLPLQGHLCPHFLWRKVSSGASLKQDSPLITVSEADTWTVSLLKEKRSGLVPSPLVPATPNSVVPLALANIQPLCSRKCLSSPVG